MLAGQGLVCCSLEVLGEAGLPGMLFEMDLKERSTKIMIITVKQI